VKERKFSRYVNSSSADQYIILQKPYKIFAKNKSVESTVHETGLPDAASREVSMENTDEGSKAKSVNFKMSGSQSFRGSCMIPFTTPTFYRSVLLLVFFYVFFIYQKT
jgi:hypothetical protein